MFLPYRPRRIAPLVVVIGLLFGCGGGAGPDPSSSASSTGDAHTSQTAPSEAASTPQPGAAEGASVPTSTHVLPTTTLPRTRADAARFLQQASMGPTDAAIDRVLARGYAGWIDDQLAIAPPGSPCLGAASAGLAASHCSLMTTVSGSLDGSFPRGWVAGWSFWKQAATAEDQLRQRVAFALSQIFVVSLMDDQVHSHGRVGASYLDMLGRGAFGNFRQLIENVALHPAMGLYLSHLRNQGQAGTKPDENFARELMQLFTIGLVELGPDGTPRLGGDGRPVETYRAEDVTGLAKVFTGFSWASTTRADAHFFTGDDMATRDIRPMVGYPRWHAQDAKSFLGITCPAGATPEQSLKCALDRLFAHPNVGPFVGRQLIQRLVTSNPSPAYVARVAAAFADNAAGVRGDLAAVLRAVLLDPEARDPIVAADPAFGRLKEPVLRVTQWMRAVGARSATGDFRSWPTHDPVDGIGMSPLFSPSVFNFYRPGYVPPRSDLAQRGLVGPEFQLVDESSAAGYLNFMMIAVPWGFGIDQNVQPDHSVLMAIAHDPDALLDKAGVLLAGGPLSTGSRAAVRQAIAAIPMAGTTPEAQQLDRWRRVITTVFLVLASPDAMVQR